MSCTYLGSPSKYTSTQEHKYTSCTLGLQASTQVHKNTSTKVAPWISKQVHPLRVELGEQVRGWSVLHWDAHAVQRRHPLLLASLHLQGAVLKTPHGVHPGLLRIGLFQKDRSMLGLGSTATTIGQYSRLTLVE